ncbi:TetR family transcriptional regulator [Glycomyces scopariae]|uniref:Transcriptional regulator, TetR family n=1 Tax=Glycomyces sambucus TaxID=380244 RepID=A0A1G9EY37_9ACTN|nr:TetR family transcriptional regulator [Glycomyces sambucus]SDK81003.1 transcriptional regulator, TetR family [Glycomyces sambucus]
MAESTGLRERKKAATKAALSEAALRLAIAKEGIESVTAEEIAAEAGVSTRTFHNYFPSKEAALLYDFHETTGRLLADLRERARTQPIWDAFRDATIDMHFDEKFDIDDMRCREQLIHSSPSLIKEQSGQFMELFAEAIDIVAASTGTSKDDLYPRLLLGAALVTMKSSTEHWLSDPGERTLAEAITEAFALFERGITQPPPAPAT